MVELEVRYGEVLFGSLACCTLVKRVSDPYRELSLAGLAISGRLNMVTFATTPFFHSLVLWKLFPLSAAVTSSSS